jgi:alpha-glucosidase
MPLSGDISIITCLGYIASNVQYTGTGITADLKLAGRSCDFYGFDLKDLRLTVDYETGGPLECYFFQEMTYSFDFL